MPNGRDLSELQFLVVDDEPFIRSMVCRVLKKIGATQVTEATDGADGMAKIAKSKPDMVLLDIMMEPMNGLTFLKTVRMGVSGATWKLPVIVLSGSDDRAVFGTAMALDCNAFVQKSSNLGGLEARIRRVADEKMEYKESRAYRTIMLPDLKAAPPPPPEDLDPDYLPPAREIPLDDAKPGAVIARDVEAGKGNLLLAAGAVITPGHLARLRDLAEFIELPTIWVTV